MRIRKSTERDFERMMEIYAYRKITDGDWMDESPYGVVHRIAADGSEGVSGHSV